jgi:hypothetical protein
MLDRLFNVNRIRPSNDKGLGGYVCDGLCLGAVVAVGPRRYGKPDEHSKRVRSTV